MNHASNSCSSNKRCFVCSKKHRTFENHETQKKTDHVVITDSPIPLVSSSYQADLLLRSSQNLKFKLPMQAPVMKSLIHMLSKKRFIFKDWPHLRDLELADLDRVL